ncbi:MAG: glycosyltransferase family 117 protein, partial [Gammaproteobacteria bacterium]
MPRPADSVKPVGTGYEWLSALAVVVVVFVVYALTAARTVVLEDDGLFVMASFNAGVAHPPGYPLYALLGYFFSWLPVDPPAFRIHLLSGLLGALACGVLFFVSRLAGLPRWFALTVALACGVSEHFWSQAVIAEVYTLNALLCFSVLLFCLRAVAKDARPARELTCAAFCFGLGLANHWPLLVLAFPGYVILLWSKRRFVRPHLPKLLGIALATAGALYLWMVWRSVQVDAVSFYGPIDSLEKFWYYLSRQGYDSADVSPSAGLADKLNFLRHFLGEVFFLFSPAGVPLALLGIYQLYRQRARALLAATVWIFLAHSLLLILLLGFDYDFLKLAVFRPYPLVAYGMMAVWVGCGLTLIWEWLRQQLPDWSGNAVFNTLPTLALLIPMLLLQKNLVINDRSDDRVAENYARLLLEGLEDNAVLFVTGDLSTGPVGYLHYVAGVRPDVTLMSTQGLIYPTRLFSSPTTRE